jgi:hypothetical protein
MTGSKTEVNSLLVGACKAGHPQARVCCKTPKSKIVTKISNYGNDYEISVYIHVQDDITSLLIFIHILLSYLSSFSSVGVNTSISIQCTIKGWSPRELYPTDI